MEATSHERLIGLGLLFLLGGAGVAMRLLLAGSYFGNHDQVSYDIVVGILGRGGNIYAETARYNYPPLWAWLLMALSTIAHTSGLAFPTVVRSALTLVDCANAALLSVIAVRHFKLPWFVAPTLYLANPVAILIVGFHGQFETLALLPVLIAMGLADPSRRAPNWAFWGLGLASLAIKHITLFVVVAMFWSRWRRVPAVGIGLGSAALAVGLTFLPYAVAADAIVRNVLTYSASPGLYGLTVFWPVAVVMPLFIVASLAAPIIATRILELDGIDTLEFSALVMLATIPGIGEQYFLIPILLGAVRRSIGWWVASVTIAAFLLSSPNNLRIEFAPPLWQAVWIAIVFWLVASAARAWRDRDRTIEPLVA